MSCEGCWLFRYLVMKRYDNDSLLLWFGVISAFLSRWRVLIQPQGFGIVVTPKFVPVPTVNSHTNYSSAARFLLFTGFQINIWSQLPWGQPTSEIKLPPRKFTCPSFFVYFHVVISSYLKIYDTKMCCTLHTTHMYNICKG